MKSNKLLLLIPLSALLMSCGNSDGSCFLDKNSTFLNEDYTTSIKPSENVAASILKIKKICQRNGFEANENYFIEHNVNTFTYKITNNLNVLVISCDINNNYISYKTDNTKRTWFKKDSSYYVTNEYGEEKYYENSSLEEIKSQYYRFANQFSYNVNNLYNENFVFSPFIDNYKKIVIPCKTNYTIGDQPEDYKISATQSGSVKLNSYTAFNDFKIDTEFSIKNGLIEYQNSTFKCNETYNGVTEEKNVTFKIETEYNKPIKKDIPNLDEFILSK